MEEGCESRPLQALWTSRELGLVQWSCALPGLCSGALSFWSSSLVCMLFAMLKAHAAMLECEPAPRARERPPIAPRDGPAPRAATSAHGPSSHGARVPPRRYRLTTAEARVPKTRCE